MKRILIAEDNDVNAKLLIAILDKTYDVARARTGKEVLELVTTQHFDLILMDLEMPELDGWETTRLLRLQRSLWLTPILAASAYVNYWQTAQLAGCTDYIAKPYKPDDVLAKVARYVGL